MAYQWLPIIYNISNFIQMYLYMKICFNDFDLNILSDISRNAVRIKNSNKILKVSCKSCIYMNVFGLQIKLLGILFLSVVLQLPGQLWATNKKSNLTHSILINNYSLIWPKGHCEPGDEIGSESSAKQIIEIQTRIFQIQSRPIIPHSPLN